MADLEEIVPLADQEPTPTEIVDAIRQLQRVILGVGEDDGTGNAIAEIQETLESLKTSVELLNKFISRFSAVEGSNGSLTVPYTETSSITINWGSQSMGENSKTTENFVSSYDTVYQTVVASSEDHFSADACTVPAFTDSGATLLNGAGSTNTVRMIAVGKTNK